MMKILDGGIGIYLRESGAPFEQPEWSALALIEEPDSVRRAHLAFAEAGAGVITTNSYALVPFHIGEFLFEKEGKDLTIVTYSIMLQKSKEAALRLKEEYNLDTEIIDLQTLRPLDTETILNSVKKTNRLITVEESWPFGSVGSEIANIVQRDAFDYLDSPVIKVNSADVPMPYALSLEKLYLPQVDDIINAAKKVSYIK